MDYRVRKGEDVVHPHRLEVAGTEPARKTVARLGGEVASPALWGWVRLIVGTFLILPIVVVVVALLLVACKPQDSPEAPVTGRTPTAEVSR